MERQPRVKGGTAWKRRRERAKEQERARTRNTYI